METFTWGIIGPGQIAKQFAEDMLLANAADYKLGAVLGLDMESARAFAEEHSVESYFDEINAFLEHGKMDAVYIATPHPMHHNQTLLCLKKGIPVLCEKPLAVNKEQADEMIAVAEAQKVFLMEGLWVCFLPSTQFILDKLKDGRLGKITSIKSDIGFVADKDPNARFFDADLGGGSLLDVGIYNVFLAQLLLGYPTEIKANATLSNQLIDKECSFEFMYPNGVVATGKSSFVNELDTTATISCEHGKIFIGSRWQETPSEIKIEYADGTTQINHPKWDGHGFQYEIDAVYNDIQTGRLQNEKASHSFSQNLTKALDEIREKTGIVYPYDANPDAAPETR